MKKRNLVYICSIIISALIAFCAICFKDSFQNFSNLLFDFMTKRLGWLYLIAMLFFVGFTMCVAVSKYGRIRLGNDDSRPEYSNVSWFAMLFCAGMGVGLVFWGISEPLSHYISPAAGVEPLTNDAIDFAFKSVFMHWGIHPWAAYAIIGLPLAYFQFRKGKPGLISSLVEPLVGERLTHGYVGKIVDILAAFATIAGIVTSLGLGVLQINSGLEAVFGLPNNIMSQILIIMVITAIFILSAVSGIDKGVKKLSNITLVLIIFFMIICFFIGPKQEIVNNFTNGLGLYLNDFFKDSLMLPTYGDSSWTTGWRIFYWAWWIAWAPFVGMFIARISKGRTIREFIFGVVLVPSIASFIWFSIFGSLGIHLGVDGTLDIETLTQVANKPEIGLFVVLAKYPIAIGTSIIALILLMSFFITSADSGTYVLAMICSDGNITPPNSKKIVWGLALALIAIGLLLAGGLKPLQTISIAAAFPFILIMIVACIALLKELKKEYKE